MLFCYSNKAHLNLRERERKRESTLPFFTENCPVNDDWRKIMSTFQTLLSVSLIAVSSSTAPFHEDMNMATGAFHLIMITPCQIQAAILRRKKVSATERKEERELKGSKRK